MVGDLRETEDLRTVLKECVLVTTREGPEAERGGEVGTGHGQPPTVLGNRLRDRGKQKGGGDGRKQEGTGLSVHHSSVCCLGGWR